MLQIMGQGVKEWACVHPPLLSPHGDPPRIDTTVSRWKQYQFPALPHRCRAQGSGITNIPVQVHQQP